MATSARLTITTNFSDDVFFYELGTSDSLDTLRMLLESESAVPVAEQVLIFNNREATVSARFFRRFFFFLLFPIAGLDHWTSLWWHWRCVASVGQEI